MAGTTELNFIQKRFLVQQLACFLTPSAAAKAFKAEFGFDVTPSRVAYYNPSTKSGAALADDLKAIFADTRQKYLTEIDGIPLANKAYRLHQLQKQLDYFSEKNAAPIVLNILEAAAKEIGGAFTNKHQHEHTGKGGGPIATVGAMVTDPKEAAQIYSRMINGPE